MGKFAVTVQLVAEKISDKTNLRLQVFRDLRESCFIGLEYLNDLVGISFFRRLFAQECRSDAGSKVRAGYIGYDLISKRAQHACYHVCRGSLAVGAGDGDDLLPFGTLADDIGAHLDSHFTG